MRLAFFGTPTFAVPTLAALARHHSVALVVAQPDRPSGRGMRNAAPPVAMAASALGIPLLQPARIRDEAFLNAFRETAPDAAIVVAYGRILPAALLSIPRFGFLNVHASLLPKYRGAAPIQRAIENGDSFTGVSIMQIDEELDHGPVFGFSGTAIEPDEHTPALAARLSSIGAEAMLGTLEELENGTADPIDQEHDYATIAPKIEKQEGLIRWSDSAKVIYDRFRAFDPWPGIFTSDGIKLIDVEPVDGNGAAGEILEMGSSVTIATGSRALRIRTLQRPGKPKAAAGDVARGLGWAVGDRLS